LLDAKDKEVPFMEPLGSKYWTFPSHPTIKCVCVFL
jgi:hypothetical protein